MSGLIRVLTKWNATHDCHFARRDNDRDNVNDDVNDDDTHENADDNGVDRDNANYVNSNDNRFVNDYNDDLGFSHSDYQGYPPSCVPDLRFCKLCEIHGYLVRSIENFLKRGAGYSHFAAVLQLYDSELGQAVHTPCGYGQKIREIRVDVRRIVACYHSNTNSTDDSSSLQQYNRVATHATQNHQLLTYRGLLRLSPGLKFGFGVI